jgi:hypothetical protein
MQQVGVDRFGLAFARGALVVEGPSCGPVECNRLSARPRVYVRHDGVSYSAPH